MNKGAFSGQNYCGGIIGNNKSTSIDNCEFGGQIVIPDTFSATAATYIGGIAGYYNTATGTSPTVSNCVAGGTLFIQSRGSGQMDIGGVFGYIGGLGANPVNVVNCRYEAGDITAMRTLGSGIFYAGGFAGYIGSFSIFSGCRSLAGSVSAHSNSSINVGGFAGGMSAATLEGCYALTNVSSTGSAAQLTGGLVGSAVGGSEISRCYAAGSVQAISTAGTDGFYTGGLVGNVNNTDISDSYALGNVLADKTAGTGNGAVNAGGLAGSFASSGKIIERCFSAGTVRAMSAGTGIINAGGIAGQGGSGTMLQNNAALGASVTVQGSGTRSIGRVYGATFGTASGNYAVDTMRIEKSDVYGTYYFPYWDGTSTEPSVYYTVSNSTDAAAKNGSSVAASAFRNSAFWTSTLTFDVAEWNFGGVVSRGYPILANVGGQ
jgi:hypothetical protein